MKSTTEVKKLYDLCGQYAVFEPWLKENGYTLKDLPLTAQTEDGEDVIVEAYTQDGEIVWMISTMQNNGWMCIKRYYIDGTVEESFSR